MRPPVIAALPVLLLPALVLPRAAFGQQGTAATPSLAEPAPAPVAPAPDAPAAPTPAPAQPAPPPAPPAPPATPASPPPPPPKDALPAAGYLPGYRTYPSFGLSPYVPTTGALPGGVTPAYGAPMPPGDWTFRWSGFLNMSAQFGFNRRIGELEPGQSRFVIHVPPNTVDEYQSFVGTSTMPGQWIQMNFAYGNRAVSANITLSTWNPSNPTTYYQLGSQNFIQNAFLNYDVPPAGGVRINLKAGYLYGYYGNLSQYGPGIYQSPVVGGPRGVGFVVHADRDLGPSLVLAVEGGFMGNRNGKNPDCPPSSTDTGSSLEGCGRVSFADPNRGLDPIFPGSYVHHLHAGVTRKGDFTVRAQVHYMQNWSHDDRTQIPFDNQVTRDIDESYARDGTLSVYGADVTVSHPIYGFLGVGGSYLKGHHAAELRGLLTFGGEGLALSNRWWGDSTTGSGTLAVGGINYSTSVGKMVNPTFGGDGPDLLIDAGGVVAAGTSDADAGTLPNSRYDNRVRYKFGASALYKFIRYMGAGVRGDYVVPTSKDSSETFQVLAARLVFKTGWNSRESLMLLYAKWFYGPNTHPEFSANRSPRIDDQLFALNVNMWW